MGHIMLHKKKVGEIKSNWSIPAINPAKIANTKEDATQLILEQ